MQDIDEIRRKRIEELRRLQQGSGEQAQERQAMQQQIAQIEAIAKSVMTKEALERYGNLRAAFPDRAIQVAALLAQLVQQGKITGIDDKMFKSILEKVTPEKRDIKIKRA
ncbi:hypothetical protein J4212_05420 [Candidatus Woesearchaeota archaeon]|nr:hypothetical protein [Candidatus Woesearchaeota archaeon]